MTKTSVFMSHVETDLRTTRQISEATRASFDALPAESRAAIRQMTAFVGCETPAVEGFVPNRPTGSGERRAPSCS